MKKSIRGCSLAIVIAILLPLAMMGLQNTATQPSVWIVYSDNQDRSIELASQTFSDEILTAGCIVREASLSELDLIPLHSDAIILVGHGQKEGIVLADELMPWSDLYDSIRSRKPMHTVILACHSPSDVESRIFGFMGEIDAEAGALIASWYISQVFDLGNQAADSFGRISEAQKALENPLARYVYFVHGYFGNPNEFTDMKDYLDLDPVYADYAGWRDFSYSGYNGAYTDQEKNLLHYLTTVSDYANNFTSHLLSTYGPGTQINIVAHSLGGIITRQMLALNRATLENAGIDIGTVITLGTPHHGTYLADADNIAAAIYVLGSVFATAQLWPSPVFYSMHPDSCLISDLNTNPESYSDGIRWYTAAGVDTGIGGILSVIHGEYSDYVIGESKAKLSFANSAPTFYHTTHGELPNDPDQASYGSVAMWLATDYDSDGDMIDDDMETYVYYTDSDDWDSDGDQLSDGHEILYYGTNPLSTDSDGDSLSDYDELQEGSDPNDPDSDNDGLTDGNEVHIHNTLPTAWSTDGDILSDNQEITWGYDPLDTDDPIDSEYLTYSTWQVHGTTGYVRANHFAAMDYVKIYVKYKTSYGQWTGYIHVGTDSTPDYYGDYKVQWSLLQGYVQMYVIVHAYDAANHYLGSDTQYVTLPGGGGGGGPLPV